MKKLYLFMLGLVLLSSINSNAIALQSLDLQIAKGKVITVENNKLQIDIKKGICKGKRFLRLNTDIDAHTLKNKTITFIINGECNKILKILKSSKGE